MYRALLVALAASIASVASSKPLSNAGATPDALPKPPPPQPNFYLQTKVPKGGDKAFDNLWITTFHTGAGLAAGTATTNKSIAAAFYLFKNTYLALNISAGIDANPQEVPYTFGLEATTPARSTAPDAYKYVSIDGGLSTRNFYITKTKSGTAGFVHVKPTKKIPYKTFAVCAVDGIEPYKNVGPQKQLLWRPKGVAPVEHFCEDVRLKTVKYP